jgi:hypothetical protein
MRGQLTSLRAAALIPHRKAKKLRTAARTVFPESRRHGINAQVRAISVPTVKVDHASQEGLAANGEQRSPAREP